MHGREKEKKNLTILVFSYMTYLTIVGVYTKFEDSGSLRSWEICDKKEENEKSDK